MNAQMSPVWRAGLLAFAPLLLLSSCSPAQFDITVCQVRGTVMFELSRIHGYLLPRQPRPTLIQVSEEILDVSAPPLMWHVERSDESRRKLSQFSYGQHLPGWTVRQTAVDLRQGRTYTINIHDRWNYGVATFRYSRDLPSC